MRGLDALLATSEGRRFLAEQGTYDDPETFVGHLRPPAGESGGALPVYVHQQVYLDYRSSVVAKVLALRQLAAGSAAVRPEFLWIDTDRAGSDKLTLRLYLDGPRGPVAVRLAPARCEQREPRAIALDAGRLAEGLRRLERLILARPDGETALARFERLRPLLTADGSLADLSRRLTDAVFEATLDFRPQPVRVSGLIADGSLAQPLAMLLEQRSAFIAAVNARIAALRALDIDPHLQPLAEDYLPLFITSPADGRRLRLRFVQDGRLALAFAVDPAGRQYRYPLRSLSPAALEGRVGWSPDVTLPLLVARRYSGLVAGRSSALYMLVLGDALRRVLGQAPLPVLVPTAEKVFAGAFDSLFAAHLDGCRL